MIPDLEKIDRLDEHIDGVHRNCIKLGRRLIARGEVTIGRELIMNGLMHDSSKFMPPEWDNLWQGANKSQFDAALQHHRTNNRHHPEYWGGIHQMERVYIAEMICDWKARASEFGTSLMDYIRDKAMKVYSFSETDHVFIDIVYFASLLCDQAFN